MRICIYGAGAMGISLGTALESTGTQCDFVTRNADYVRYLREKGLRAYFPEEMEGTYDLIFLATKQRENRAIARFLEPFLEADGMLVTVQNGLPEGSLAEVLGKDRIYGCALGWGAEIAERNGKIVVTVTSEGSKLKLALGAYGRGERLGEIVSLFENDRFEATVGDLNEIRYSKLVVNASFSTLSAISSLTFGELARKRKKLALALMRETIAVAKSCGCKRLVQNGHDILKLFSSPFAAALLPIAMKKHSDIRSGMFRDIEAGRRCDVDFVAGAVVREGEKRGVPTPMLKAAVALVHDIENGLAELAPASLDLLIV